MDTLTYNTAQELTEAIGAVDKMLSRTFNIFTASDKVGLKGDCKGPIDEIEARIREDITTELTAFKTALETRFSEL